MKFLKIILLLILFIFIFHFGLHIYYMSVGIDGHWYNKYGREWIINSEELELDVVEGHSVIVKEPIEVALEDGRVVYFNQYKPYGISEFGGRLRTSSNLQSDDIEYWYRCPFKTIPIRLFSNY